MNINRTGNKKQGGTFKCNSTVEVTPNQMRLLQSQTYLKFVIRSVFVKVLVSKLVEHINFQELCL